MIEMKNNLAVYFIILGILLSTQSCSQEQIKFEIYSKGVLMFEILPEDIEYYDSSNQIRSGIEIHELRLKKGFYEEDSILLKAPLELICKINNKKYFKSTLFQQKQSEPRLWVNFKFDSSCKNEWTFQEQKLGELILRTKNECNSIELFHRKNEIELNRRSYYEKKEDFLNYIDTARLAHEILLDTYYLNTLSKNGILVK